jgi:hypothetical protein
MEIEQRYVIKFFLDEGMKPLNILLRAHDHYGPCAFSRSTLYFWIGEISRGRKDLSDIPRPGNAADESVATVIARPHEQDPHLSARKLAQSIRISHMTVGRYLSEFLGLKCLRLR